MSSTVIYFNLDLTLTEMEEGFDECFRETMRDLGVEESNVDAEKYYSIFQAYFEDLEEKPRDKAFKGYFGDDIDIEPSRASRIYKQKELDAVKPVKNIEGVLKELKEHFIIGIITAGTEELQEDKLDKLDISEMFEDVLITYGEGLNKIELFKRAENRVEAEKYVYFSNSESDIRKAKEHGWETVYMDFENLGEDPVRKIESELNE